MSIDVNWYRKMKELKAELESVSDVMQDTKHLIYEWVKEYLDERSDQP
jgi:predicted CopG family antitoxin